MCKGMYRCTELERGEVEKESMLQGSTNDMGGRGKKEGTSAGE